MQARLYGREVTFSVRYPFKVPCTEAEKCDVDSPLDKARHVQKLDPYNMRLRDDKYDLVAGRPRAWLCI